MHLPLQAFGVVEALTYGRPGVQMPAITKRERWKLFVKEIVNRDRFKMVTRVQKKTT
jgi:hypothetical protein